jgi:hypothetical protein
VSASPFGTIESAQIYLRLLGEAVDEARETVQEDIRGSARDMDFERRLEALRVVEYKLLQLRVHLGATARLLNDLRRLERLLLGSASDDAHRTAELQLE